MMMNMMTVMMKNVVHVTGFNHLNLKTVILLFLLSGQNVTFVITGPISHTVPQLELSGGEMNLDALTVQTAVK